MKYSSFILISSVLFLSACGPKQNVNQDVDHMSMDHGMMGGDQETMLSGDDIDLSTLPEALATETLEVENGDTIDLNPQIVQKTINGQSFAFYGYNGQFPGPTIVAKQGSTFTVRVKNEIDQPTTVHWHGIRLANANDGVPDLTQKPIQPKESFTYTVTVPDDGIYWYHPHVREDVQQDLGLYGNLLVVPEDTDSYAPVNQEQVIALDDLLIASNGLPVSYGKDEADHALMGRFGNTMLINGETDLVLPSVHKGSVSRFYFTNTANTRTFHIAFKGAKMKLVGGDSGRLEKEKFVDSVIIAPSERVIVDVYFEKSGTVTLQHIGPESRTLATLTVDAVEEKTSYATEFSTERTNKDIVADIDAYKKYLKEKPDHIMHLSITTKMMMGGMGHMAMGQENSEGIEWEDSMAPMNAMSSKINTQWKLIDEATGKTNMDISYLFPKDELVKIRIVNDTVEQGSDHPMQHPIHFHGNRFVVLADNDVPTTNMVWKDTVLVPTGHTVDILLEASNLGEWMMHCHISEHLSNGMMGKFTVQ